MQPHKQIEQRAPDNSSLTSKASRVGSSGDGSAGCVTGESIDPVRTILRMKLQILRNGFENVYLRRNTVVALVLTLLGGVFGGVLAFQNANASPGARAKSLITSFTLMFVAWLFAPLLPGGLDDTIDPRRLALFPLTGRERRRGVLLASAVGFLPLASLLVLATSVAANITVRAAPFVVAAALSHLMICLLVGRLVGALLIRAGRSRRGRDLAMTTAAVSAVALWGATQSLVFVSARTFDRVLHTLQRLPSGISAQAVLEARDGNFAGATLQLVQAACVIAATYWLWAWAFDDSGLIGASTRPPARRRRVRVRRFSKKGSSLPMAQWRVLVGKELRYLRRSPQRRASLLISMVLGGPFLLFQFFAHASTPKGVYLAPLALVFAFGSVNNLIGIDAPSLWLEVISGAQLRTIVMSRSIASAPLVMLPVLTAATAISLVVGFTVHYAVVVMLTVLCVGIPLGVGCVASVLVPFPQHDVDDPASNKRTATGEGCLAGLVSGITMACSAVLLLPVAALRMYLGTSGSNLILLGVLTTVYSGVVWFVAASTSGRWADQRSPELLATLTSRNSNS